MSYIYCVIMTSNKIQEYIFENKEQIPDGIYKELQDLLKITHKEEQYDKLYEVKYVYINVECRLSKITKKKFRNKYSYDDDCIDYWDSEPDMPSDCESDSDETKHLDKIDATKIYHNCIDIKIPGPFSKICKFIEVDNYSFTTRNDFYNGIINNKDIDYFKKKGYILLYCKSEHHISSRSDNNKIFTSKDKILITDIKPYKP